MNINDRVRVKLTPAGKARLNDFRTSINNALYSRTGRPQVTEATSDVFEDSLWEVMHIFGPMCYNGGTPPFVDNEVELSEGYSEPTTCDQCRKNPATRKVVGTHAVCDQCAADA